MRNFGNSPKFTVRAAAVSVAAAVVLSPALASSAAATSVRPATALLCDAAMSNNHPADHTTVYVHVHTVSHAEVTAIAHFKNTTSKNHRKANATGRTTVSFGVGSTLPGFSVTVSVTVKSGRAKGTCSTAFTPHA
jgi:hypothetical protein